MLKLRAAVVLLVALAPSAAWCAYKCTSAEGSVSFQAAPCPAGSKSETVSAQAAARELSAGTSDSSTKIEATTATIRAKCAEEWPDDFRMRAFCERQQEEGLRTLQAGPPVSGREASVIREKCTEEWPRDFRMRAFCERQQADGLRTLQAGPGASGPEASIIRNKCAEEWPRDFRMRAFCERQQVEGLKKLRGY
jgi:hypothetical protein